MRNDQRNKSGNMGTGQERHLGGTRGYCVCLKCGYSVKHEPGIPCNTQACPTCKTPMFRSETSGRHPDSAQKKAENKPSAMNTNKKQYPTVVAEKCISCGACIDICPMNTIILKDKKAFVVTDNCRNCRVCMQNCPADAFILE